MDLKQTRKNIDGIWGCLPVRAILFQYLDIDDFIELGKCCKLYRKQLEPKIWKKLSLCYWRRNNWKVYNELEKAYEIEKVLGYAEIELSSKLEFVNEFDLDFWVERNFAQAFVKFLPNIKNLNLYGVDEYDCCLGEGLSTILRDMKYLEYVYICDIEDIVRDYNPKNQIFPKSIKHLKISIDRDVGTSYSDDELSIYDTIDASYTNLQSLTIVSNRVLKNLSSGISTLQEVEINDYYNLNSSNFATFLKGNPQLRKLKTSLRVYNEEIIKTILCSKHLEYWCIDREPCEIIEVNNLPFNYSVKYLKISTKISAPLTLKLINCCKILETLKFKCYDELNDLDLTKLARRVNKLKLSICYNILNFIKKINSLSLFSEIYIGECNSVKKLFEDSTDTAINYKYVPLISGACILKIINKTD